MQVIKSFFIAVSIYSKIPVPQFAWNEEDMKYTFCFFPWIGALIGCCIYFWNHLCDGYHIGDLCRIAFSCAIPLLITGGFHADGFMDTMDAIHSYGPREKKLQILKDPHIGAFAVIMLAVYGLVFFSAFSEIQNDALLKIACSGFFLSRCFCGISAVSFPLAKKEGMLSLFADSSQKRTVTVSLYVQSIACIGYMLRCFVLAGTAVAVTALFSAAYYYWRSKKEFGGITGDTAGCFILLCEGCIFLAAAVFDIFA